MSASSTMEDVNITVPTLRATLAARVTLAIVWTAITSTVQVKFYSYILHSHECHMGYIGSVVHIIIGLRAAAHQPICSF